MEGSELEVTTHELETAPLLEVTHEGTCADCGDRISGARLKALPDAVRCVSCQRQLESQTG